MNKWLWIAAGILLLTKKGKGQQMPVQPSLTVSQFAILYAKFAKESQDKTSVPALVTLAQAGLESGWGKFAHGNNFFGIKADGSWKGSTQLLNTKEYGTTGIPSKDGLSAKDQIIKIIPPFVSPNDTAKYLYNVKAPFRAYASPRDSFIDHGLFLKNNSRYKNAFKYTADPFRFADEVAKAGYASAPDYGQILESTMRKIAASLLST